MSEGVTTIQSNGAVSSSATSSTEQALERVRNNGIWLPGVDSREVVATIAGSNSDAYKFVQNLQALQLNAITDIGRSASIISETIGKLIEPSKPFLIETRHVRFMQNSIHHRYSKGEADIFTTAQQLSEKPESAKNVPPILLIVDAEGRIWSHGNRRLAAALLAETEVYASLMSAKRIVSERRHFTTINGGMLVTVLNSASHEVIGTIQNLGLMNSNN